jgi:phage/plasmid-like protein (TIGR03299 family)
MGHGIESSRDVVGLLHKQAWHNLGIVIHEELTAVEAAERFGMTKPVEQEPLTIIGAEARVSLEAAKRAAADGNAEAAVVHFLAFQAAIVPVETHVANVRHSDDGLDIHGIVGTGYQVCQNCELAEFTDALAQTGKVVIESCGSIMGGKRVWFLAKSESFEVGGTDTVHAYVLVCNSHDGSQSIKVVPTSIRVVCKNTYNLVVPEADGTRPESAAISIRHSGKISDKLEQARQALKYYGSIVYKNREMFEALAAKKVSRDQGIELFAGAYASEWTVATQEELDSDDLKVARTATNRFNRMKDAKKLFLKRYDEEVAKVGGEDSLWAYANAATGYIQHDVVARGTDDTVRVERRQHSNLFGLNSQRTHNVFAEALAIE